ncbi:MAG: hypothetical protein UHN02_01820 [Acutalibacteraceae bacterium]|nr:hypothetical protein [Acutalibacteraceae bacterium]
MAIKKANKYFDTDVWEPVPIVSKELRDMGYKGGEGCQWPTFMTRDIIDGQLAFFCTDVSGVYKSTDGGHSWKLSVNGFHSGSVAGVQIDPKNLDHVVAVGAAGNFHLNGVYVSWDRGETWKQTLRASVIGNHDERYQIAIDPTSYDEKLGYCTVVYWARPSIKTNANGYNHPALYKSTDGGETWSELPNTAEYGNCSMRIHPTKGWLYLINSTGLGWNDAFLKPGFWRSKDGGKTFEKLGDEIYYSIEVLHTYPDHLYLTTKKGILISHDCGDTFTCIKGKNFPEYPRYLSPCPTNPEYMMIFDDQFFAGGYGNPNVGKTYNYYSHDGGKSWHKPEFKHDTVIIPVNIRQRPSIWSPDGKSILTFGGDCVFRSEDYGKTFVSSNDGYNGMCIGAGIGYNINNPNIMLVPSQDYNGAVTVDGGKTFKYGSYEGTGWGGHAYGGYCWNENEWCSGPAKSWAGAKIGGEVEIHVTHDGGKTYEHTGVIVTGIKKCMAVRGDDDTVLFGEWKTTDRGHTWKKLTDENGERLIDGVLAYDFSSARMFAVKGGKILESYDAFETYKVIANLKTAPEGMSYDHVNKKLFLAVANNLFVLYEDGQIELIDSASDMVKDAYVKSVYVNPKNVNMIYILEWCYIDAGIESVLRSLDGGKTWTALSTMGRPSSLNLFINTLSDEVYIECGCRGIWKMKLPEVE